MRNLKIYMTILILGTIVLVASCFRARHAKEVQHWADYAPLGIEVGESLYFNPNCDWFACAGVTIYKLEPETTKQIKHHELDFFESLVSAQLGKNGRHLGPWQQNASLIEQRRLNTPQKDLVAPNYWNGAGSRTTAAQSLAEAIDQNSYYSSNNHGEPLIIISPEAEIIFVSWFD